MTIDIPTNHFAFQLDVTIKTKGLTYIRIVAVDPTKPASKYLDINGKVDGVRTFELRFPVTPKEMKIVIYNPDNGDLPYGEDYTFTVEDVKVKKIKEYDVWWNQDTKDFYEFAVDFSQNAGWLSSGQKKPDIYRSDNGKFTIDYYDTIYDQADGKFLSTPARIGHNSGVIEVSKSKFIEYTVPMRLVILMHEFAHKYLNPNINRKINYETGADIQGLYVYLGKGWSPIEAHKAFLKVFRTSNGEANHKRYKILRDFIDRYERGQVAQVSSK